MRKKRKLSFEEKEKAVKQKERMIIEQGFKCFVCGEHFTQSDPPEMSHRIIQKYEIVYGAEIIHHPVNTPICHKTCNSKVILWPEKESGKKHIERIREAIENENL